MGARSTRHRPAQAAMASAAPLSAESPAAAQLSLQLQVPQSGSTVPFPRPTPAHARMFGGLPSEGVRTVRTHVLFTSDIEAHAACPGCARADPRVPPARGRRSGRLGGRRGGSRGSASRARMGSRAPRVAAWMASTAAGRPTGGPAAGVPVSREKHFLHFAYAEVSLRPDAEPSDLQAICEVRRAQRSLLGRAAKPRLTALGPLTIIRRGPAFRTRRRASRQSQGLQGRSCVHPSSSPPGSC